MTETEKLKAKMDELCISAERLADITEIPVGILKEKIHGNTEFLASEIYAIGKALMLAPDEVYKIFLKNK